MNNNNNNNNQAALSPHLEKPYILPGIKQKPADIYIPNWSRGESLAMDSGQNGGQQIRSASFISILLAISKACHCFAEEQCPCNDC